MNRDFLKKLKIEFLGKDDWKKLQELIAIKCISCRTEKEFASFLEGLIASMFRNVKELDKARKKIGEKVLSGVARERLKQKLRENDKRKS